MLCCDECVPPCVKHILPWRDSCELISSQEPSQSFRLLGVLAPHDATEAEEFIPVDLLDRAPPAVGAESQDMIEVGMSRQGVLQTHGLAGRAEIE